MFVLEIELTDFEATVLENLAYTSQFTDAITEAEEALLNRLTKALRPKDDSKEDRCVP